MHLVITTSQFCMTCLHKDWIGKNYACPKLLATTVHAVCTMVGLIESYLFIGVFPIKQDRTWSLDKLLKGPTFWLWVVLVSCSQVHLPHKWDCYWIIWPFKSHPAQEMASRANLYISMGEKLVFWDHWAGATHHILSLSGLHSYKTGECN